MGNAGSRQTGDEINRTAPKVQSALLEAMQERRVTIGKQSLSLGLNRYDGVASASDRPPARTAPGVRDAV